MAKKIKTTVKLTIPGGQANPAPPIGPALGQHGLNIMDFCQKFNEATKERPGELTPAIITVYEDRSFDFITKTPPVGFLLKKAAGIEKGSPEPNRQKVGKVTQTQLKEIAKTKMADLNTTNLDAAVKIVEGTAKSLGIEVG